LIFAGVVSAWHSQPTPTPPPDKGYAPASKLDRSLDTSRIRAPAPGKP
jgi:hypothetical protein